MHVVDDDQPRRLVDYKQLEAERLLWKLAHALRRVNGVYCNTRVHLGSPFVRIVQATEDNAPIYWSSTLTVGSRLRSGLELALRGYAKLKLIHGS